jgi:hypothetical protein
MFLVGNFTNAENQTKVMSLNSPFYVDKDLVQPRISDDIRNSVLPLIALNESSIQKATPRNVGSSPNITSNLFNLTEAPAQSFGSLGGGASSGGSVRRRPEDERPSWRDRDPRNEEKYQENKAEQEKLKTDRQNKVNEINSRTPKETPDQRSDRQATRLASVIDRTSKQDPSTLSAKDAGELALAKIMMKGGDLSTPTVGFEAKVKSKVADLQGKNVLSPELSGSGNQMQDDIDALAAAKNSPAAARSKAYFDADTESTFDVSRDATKRDVAQRDQQNRTDAAQQAADRKEKMQGVKIQGTNMTYGQFKANTGRDYDATSKGATNYLNLAEEIIKKNQ